MGMRLAARPSRTQVPIHLLAQIVFAYTVVRTIPHFPGHNLAAHCDELLIVLLFC